nr:MAG TPA: hypothetical protein [Caudoviricetes sp.]
MVISSSLHQLKLIMKLFQLPLYFIGSELNFKHNKKLRTIFKSRSFLLKPLYC